MVDKSIKMIQTESDENMVSHFSRMPSSPKDEFDSSEENILSSNENESSAKKINEM